MKIKINNNIKIFSPPNWLEEKLKQKYRLPNPKYVEAKRMGRWIKHLPPHLLFYQQSKNYTSIPIGEMEELLFLLNKEEQAFSIHDKRTEVPCSILFTGKLKEFQSKAMQEVLEYSVGTLEAPTGSGKTVCGLFAIAYRKQKTLILVHTKDLAYQWVERACSFLDMKPQEIGFLGDGKKQIGKRLTIGMIQTCSKMKLNKEFGMVVADENHRCPSTLFLTTLANLQCKYRLGLSATMYRRDGLNKIINWYCGPLRYSVDKKQLIEDGHILQPFFIMKKTNFKTTGDAVANYSGVMSEMALDIDRNTQIVKDIVGYASNPETNILVLSDRKKHLFLLNSMLKGKGIEPLLLTGDTPKKERNKITEGIGKTSNVLLATAQLVGEGFDCPDLNILFMTMPIQFSGRVIQYIGRIMRTAKGKKRPIVVDYIDWRISVLNNSAKSRMKVYGKDNIHVEEMVQKRRKTKRR